MPTNTLTDSQCRSAKPTEKGRKLFDGHGLYLYVSPLGSKSFRVAYRLDGKQQTATLGPYPLLSLAAARIQRDELRRKLLEGTSPKAPPKRVQLTFAQAVPLYWAGRKDVTERYVADAVRAMEMYLVPGLGAKDLGAITREHLLDELVKVDKAGRHSYVRKIRMWASQIFDWGIEHKHCATNPAAAIRPEKAFGRQKRTSFAALELDEVPGFLDRLAFEGELQSALACRMLALTWVRTTELRNMQWSEIEGDLWRIPEGKMKRARDHLVPLSAQAMAVLEKLKLRSRGSRFVLPAEHTLERPISENAVLYLLHRMGFKGRMTGHGWRSVGSTWANERGFNPDAIERQLAHVADDKTRAAYNRAAYLPERRKMLQAWADWLENPDTGSVKG